MSIIGTKNIFSLNTKNEIPNDVQIEGIDDWSSPRSDGTTTGFSAIYQSASTARMAFRVLKNDESIDDFNIKLSFFTINSIQNDDGTYSYFATQLPATDSSNLIEITQDNVNFELPTPTTGIQWILPIKMPSFCCFNIVEITEGMQVQSIVYG